MRKCGGGKWESFSFSNRDCGYAQNGCFPYSDYLMETETVRSASFQPPSEEPDAGVADVMKSVPDPDDRFFFIHDK
ncbi:hypothetical protein V6N13_086513 [Hibiscus sabdariffa]|uniref:Uncharacterized protein n=1 Tax=Hibiscus sabdariffa TaxID=183260 RepID=A0ABR2FTE6_9ROSI